MKKQNAKTLKNTHNILKKESTSKPNNYKFNIILVILVLLIATALQIILIDDNSVWGDEAFTMVIVRHNLADFWNAIVKDVHPPLYYIILKLVMSITGESLKVAKIISILPLLLTNIIIVCMTLKDKNKLNDKKTGILLSVFIVATMLTTNFLFMAQEIRMYSWAMFFVTISGIYAYKIYNDKSKKNIAVFIVISLCAALTHYFALVMEAIIYLYLFISLLVKDKRNIKSIVIIILSTIIGYSWWLPSAISQFTKVSENFWITFNLKDIFKYLQVMTSTGINLWLEIIIIVFFIEIGIYNLYKLVIKKEFNPKEKSEIVFAFCAISLPFSTIIIGVILNLLIRPIFITRYLMPALGMFWLGIVILLKYIKKEKLSVSLICSLILIMAVMEYSKMYREERKSSKSTSDTIEFISEKLEENDEIATNISHLYWTVLNYYFPNEKKSSINNIDFNSEKNTIWYIEDRKVNIDKEYIQKAGFNIEKVYSGNIDRYYLDIYKLDKS